MRSSVTGMLEVLLHSLTTPGVYVVHRTSSPCITSSAGCPLSLNKGFIPLPHRRLIIHADHMNFFQSRTESSARSRSSPTFIGVCLLTYALGACHDDGRRQHPVVSFTMVGTTQLLSSETFYESPVQPLGYCHTVCVGCVCGGGKLAKLPIFYTTRHTPKYVLGVCI